MPIPSSGETPWVLRIGRKLLDLPEGCSFLGRSPECRFRLEDGLVSRRHARLDVDGAVVYVEDLGSVNGTLLNGELIVGRLRLRAGDRLQIGATELTFEKAPFEAEAPRGLTPTPAGSGASPWPRSSTDPNFRPFATPAPQGRPPADEEPTLIRAPPKPSANVFLTDLAEKALSLGKVDDARRLLGAIAEGISRDLSVELGAPLAREYVALSLRMAQATTEWVHVDRLLEIAARHGWPPEPTLLDPIVSLAETLRAARGPGLLSYLERWRRAVQGEPDRLAALARLQALGQRP